MDQLAQLAFVKPKAVGAVEVPGAGAAQRAAAFEVERESVRERGLTLRTEVVGGMGSGLGQASGAYRNAGVSAKGLLADAAFVREQK